MGAAKQRALVYISRGDGSKDKSIIIAVDDTQFLSKWVIDGAPDQNGSHEK